MNVLLAAKIRKSVENCFAMGNSKSFTKTSAERMRELPKRKW